jgi:hypothetical protein
MKLKGPLELVPMAFLLTNIYPSLPEGWEKSSTTKRSCTKLPDV